MNFNELVEKVHKNAIEHGFYKDFDMQRAFMLVVCEIAEAIEADRENKHCSVNELLQWENMDFHDKYFVNHIKETFECEIADVFIRLFDLAGHYELTFRNPFISDDEKQGLIDVSMYGAFTEITRYLTSEFDPKTRIYSAMRTLEVFVAAYNIDIYPFILAKMRYNKNRPILHGKRY